MKYDPFIYGRHQGEKVVSVEPVTIDDKSYMNIWYEGKSLPTQRVESERYILYPEKRNDNCILLRGGLYYKWAEKFDNNRDYQQALGIAKATDTDHYVVYNEQEAFMIKSGVTYYKGMKPKEVSVLSFDIETTGLDPVTNKCLMISNTYRAKGEITRVLFSIDEYNSEKEMIYAWCNWVNDRDPSILVGHNIFGFDLPFLKQRCGSLPIGRMQAKAKFARYVSQFRKDGSQSYDYNNVIVPGREVIDTFHLALKYDIGRTYPSYGLKAIIKHEGLEREDRQHYDAGRIGEIYEIIVELGLNKAKEQWERIKKYAEHDADDSLALFDLMIPSFFYYCQHIPKTMQQVINSATGSQVNSFMVRAYLSEGHSLPRASANVPYEGAISFGNPGSYEYVGKVDVASLYPSIILEGKVFNKDKDPKGYFLKMVKYFTDERLANKAKANETGDRHYRDLEQAQKIVINSAYGFLGAPGLLFNSPTHAAVVTKVGREILTKGIDWAKAKGWTIVNADTDSFSFVTGSIYTPVQFQKWIDELNGLYPDKIKWEDDGIYSKFIVIKAKNYILKDSTTGKVKIKGSALKATMKEPALKKFIDDIIKSLLGEGNGRVGDIYKDYAIRACNVNAATIQDWASKKTVTKSVLNPQRTNEERIKAAIAQTQVSEGDKIYVFFKTDTELCLKENFDGAYSKKKLLGKLFNTAKIFSTVIDMQEFPNLTLKRNTKVLEEIVAPSQDRETKTQQGA